MRIFRMKSRSPRSEQRHLRGVRLGDEINGLFVLMTVVVACFSYLAVLLLKHDNHLRIMKVNVASGAITAQASGYQKW